MKIIENILDDYFTKKLIEDIFYRIRISFSLDTKVEYQKNKMGKRYTQVILYAKPKHYTRYTKLFDFAKGDSLNHLTNLKCAEKSYILDKIKKIDKENLWEK